MCALCVIILRTECTRVYALLNCECMCVTCYALARVESSAERAQSQEAVF